MSVYTARPATLQPGAPPGRFHGWLISVRQVARAKAIVGPWQTVRHRRGGKQARLHTSGGREGRGDGRAG